MSTYLNTYIWLAALVSMLLFSASCTSPRWVVKDTSAIDKSDYRLLDEKHFLDKSNELSPSNPTLSLRIYSKVTYEYAEKVLLQRTIQEYKIKPWVLALGLTGAALTAFTAHTDILMDNRSSTTVTSLSLAAALMAGSGFYAMKPKGMPRPTGEERYLRKTGTMVQKDTVSVSETEGETLTLSISYGNNLLVENEQRKIDNGKLDIGLGSLLNSLEIEGEKPDSVFVNLAYRDSTYRYEYRLNDILQPYAHITAPVAELRSSPEENTSNILAELVEGSQLRIINSASEQWYRILYGISENFIARTDADMIWRTSDFAEKSEVMAVPRIPFGNVDVENNIPILSDINPNAHALVVTNQNYRSPFQSRSYAHRDGKLMRLYLENALGFPANNITEFRDIATGDSLLSRVEKLKNLAADSTTLFIYLSGYGNVELGEEGYNLSFRPVGLDRAEENISLSRLFTELSAVPSHKTIVLADIEFQAPGSEQLLSESDLDLHQPLRSLSDIITSGNSNSLVLFSSELHQKSQLYVGNGGEDKKHHLFPYFIAKALQQRITNTGAIFQFLERNIPYNSRRLHDLSQDPRAFGNTAMQIIPSR